MVSNRALSQIAEQYKIPEMVIAEQASKYMLQGGEKVKGSLFEAYVAGVYYSFLHPREGELEPEARPESKEPQEGPSDGPSGGTEVVKSALDTTSTEPSVPALTTEVVGNDTVNLTLSSDPITLPSKLTDHSSHNPVRSSISNVDSNKDLPTIHETKPKRDPSSPTRPDRSSTPTPTPTIRPSTTPSPSSPRTHGQAFDHICQWLWPLFHPIAIFLTVQLRSDPQFSSISTSTPTSTTTTAGPSEGEPSGLIITQRSGGLCVVPEIWKLEDERAVGAVGALNQFLGKHYGSGVLPTWLTRSKGQQVWKLTCIVKTPEGKEM